MTRELFGGDGGIITMRKEEPLLHLLVTVCIESLDCKLVLQPLLGTHF